MERVAVGSRRLSVVAVLLPRPVDGPCLAGTVVALGRLWPLFPYLWAVESKEPEVTPGSTSPSHPWKRRREE